MAAETAVEMAEVLAFMRTKAPGGVAFGLTVSADGSTWVAAVSWDDALCRPHNVGGTGRTADEAVRRMVEEVPYYDEAPRRVAADPLVEDQS